MSENGKTPSYVPRLKEQYRQEIVPALMKEVKAFVEADKKKLEKATTNP